MTYLTKKRTSDLKILQNILKIKFKNLDLLNCALTHRSFLSENNLPQTCSSERLEFLGDAVINLAICEYLYTNYPLFSEGQLTKIKQVVVSKDILPEVTSKLQLGDFILFGKGEKESGKYKSSILENTFEAVAGAIFIEKGYRIAKEWIINVLKNVIYSVVSGAVKTDYKSELQCISQKKYSVLPYYEIIKEEGPEHQKRFTVSVLIKGKKWGEGEGWTKKEAEQFAAKDALEKIHKRKFTKKLTNS